MVAENPGLQEQVRQDPWRKKKSSTRASGTTSSFGRPFLPLEGGENRLSVGVPWQAERGCQNCELSLSPFGELPALVEKTPSCRAFLGASKRFD